MAIEASLELFSPKKSMGEMSFISIIRLLSVFCVKFFICFIPCDMHHTKISFLFYLFKIILFFLLHLFHTNENKKSMKIISWNVNGIRAVVKKDFYNSIESMDADVYCFQETKATPEQVAASFCKI